MQAATFDDSTPNGLLSADGFSKGYDEPRDFDEIPFCGFEGAKPFTLPLLTEKEVKERIEERERTGNRLRDKIKLGGRKIKNQNGIGFCWGFCAASAVETRIVAMGMPFVSLSPASVCAPIVNFANRGGWPTKWLEWAAKNGVATSEHWPDYDRDRGRMDAPGVLADRKLYVPTEFVDLDARKDKEEAWWEAICCMVCDIPVCVGQMHWGHAVMLTDPVIGRNGEIGNELENSWRESWGDGGYGRQFGSKKYFEEGVAVHTVKAVPATAA